MVLKPIELADVDKRLDVFMAERADLTRSASQKLLKDGLVKVNGKAYAVKFENGKAVVNGKTYDVSMTEGIQEKASSASAGEGTEVKSPMPGNVLKVLVSEGDTVAENDVLFVIEAMKMETEIKAPVAGTVQAIEVSAGDKIESGQVMAYVG